MPKKVHAKCTQTGYTCFTLLLDKGTCRDDGFNYGAAAMNSRNATDFGPRGAAKFGFASLTGS
eukprot:scaffold32180_cov58-Skeletonema_marinoi.AAC.1